MDPLLWHKIVALLQVGGTFLLVTGLVVLIMNLQEPERVYSNATKKPKKHPLVIAPPNNTEGNLKRSRLPSLSGPSKTGRIRRSSRKATHVVRDTPRTGP